MFYEEGSSLDLDLIVQNYEQDRKKHWGDDEAERRFLILVDQLASTLLRGAQALVEPSQSAEPHPFSWSQVRILTEQETISDRVLERLEIDVAWEFCVETRAMARRSLDLAKLVVAAQPNSSVMRFLRRLTRCYIAGFFPECVILCRGVLENALIDAFASKGIPLPATKEGDSSMQTRINSACRLSLLSQQGGSAARLIWSRGNAAVHKDPEATQAVLETISLTAEVLNELYVGVDRHRR